MKLSRFKVLSAFIALVLIVLGFTLPLSAGQDRPAAEAAVPKAEVHPRPISGFPESGVFKLFVMESEGRSSTFVGSTIG
ncbi:MAG: hypothetical protein NTW38_07080 [Candidatus Aminicenantes bacterium]|nr:hypothetical protein [Candidatus Aminicenantes bacterium]